MSARASSSDASQSVSGRRFVRPGLRNATLILPKTGERVKRNFTLRNPNFQDYADSDDDSDTAPLLGRGQREDNGLVARTVRKSRKYGRQAYKFATSKTGQGILKCSIAYLLGSMATFVPAIAGFLGKQDGKHMVATITVYFHPARSAGSMEEATLLAFGAFVYAAFISFTSMGVSMFFGSRGLLVVGHAIVLIVFCGGGLGFVGWFKQRLGNPLVNVACSLASLAMITILTKEGSIQAATFSDDKVTQVLKMVIMGIVATTVVSLLIRPESARENLREDLVKATDSLGDMLTAITHSFLSGSEEELKLPGYVAASASYTKVFTTMVKDLGEAKYEHYFLGRERQYELEAKLVACMQKLRQNIGGLRSAAATQFTLIAQNVGVGGSSPVLQRRGSSFMFDPKDFSAVVDRHRHLSVIEEADETTSESTDADAPTGSTTLTDSLPTAATPSDIFSVFIEQLGPSMKSLAFSLKEILDELPYDKDSTCKVALNGHFRSSLKEATEVFHKAKREGLQALYESKDLVKSRDFHVVADVEEVAACCGFFSSTLEDFAEDMEIYLDSLEQLKQELEANPRPRSWSWLKFWRRAPHAEETVPTDEEQLRRPSQAALGLDIPTVPRDVQPTPSPTQGPSNSKKWTHRLHRTLSFLRRDDLKFATKVGLGASLYALPSFIPSTRPFYSHWRGEWGLLSYMLVCSMTIGASNTTGWQRFLGTCIGAGCAILAWVISDANAIPLAILGWAVSLGCFYIIIGKGKGPMGRFILLTYNLSALYAYSLSVKDEEDDDDEGGVHPAIWEIVLHRVVAVMTGCIWGIIVTRLIWPISARAKLKDGLCLLWLRMGLIWKRDPLNVLLSPDKSHVTYLDIREEMELRKFHTYLESLRASATSEIELKGPFPDEAYRKILACTSHMLDAFHAMNVVIVKDLKASEGEGELLRWTREERGYLSLRISHLFSVLASSMKLEYPLNDALPNIENARDRLLAKIFDFRKNAEGRDKAKDEDYELLYAYALVTGQLAQDILSVGTEIENLYGVLNEDTLKLQ